ncbi:hypothetical protein [uncultured Aquitalea sp.]|uniref:hypothetical protein n=1 Tax=uncultured Aquitalea sp. TaxID=540272 RepID=UPI0025DBEE98|nr:hypothetical protein [uncultured Aquitalea sp.]
MPLNLPFPPEIQQALAEFTGIRQQIHASPELKFEEKRTSELVTARLREWGDASTGVGKTGVAGSLSLGHGKKRISMRADMVSYPSRRPRTYPIPAGATARCTPAAMTVIPPFCWPPRLTWLKPDASTARCG